MTSLVLARAWRLSAESGVRGAVGRWRRAQLSLEGCAFPLTSRGSEVTIIHRHRRFSCAASSSNPVEETSEGREEEASLGEVSSSTGHEEELAQREWTPGSRRTGAIAVKLGMTQLWNKEGRPMAVTVLRVLDNQVVMVRRQEKEGYSAMQIGAVNHNKIKRVKKSVLGQFQKADVPVKRKLWEFKVTEDAILPVGTKIEAAHFVPGQYVDVTGTSIGKGFQGVMKRHGMKGQRATHGATKTHRKMGATGGGQDPGRIWPGKRMAGRMGGKSRNAINVKVHRVNHQYNILYVNGPVPGAENSYVKVKDAHRKTHLSPPPFPTYIPNPTSPLPEETYSDVIHVPHESTILYPDKTEKRAKR